jgi:tetratricopeptide (TPR) repeat protein
MKTKFPILAACAVVALLALAAYFVPTRLYASPTSSDNPQVSPAAHALCQFGSQALTSADYNAAIAAFDAALRHDPQYASAYSNRGMANAAKGVMAQAIYDFNAALQFDPADADSYFDRANAHFAQGDYRAALEDYNRALQLDPRDPHAYFGRAAAYRGLGDAQRATDDNRHAGLLEAGFDLDPMSCR